VAPQRGRGCDRLFPRTAATLASLHAGLRQHQPVSSQKGEGEFGRANRAAQAAPEGVPGVAESGAKAQLGASLNVPPELIGHRSESRRKALHHCARLDKANGSFGQRYKPSNRTAAVRV
jgi:hypothetical protein